MSYKLKSQIEQGVDWADGLIQIEKAEYRPGPTAQRLHASLCKTRLNVGGLASGKTRATCEHLNHMALVYPGAAIILARKDLGDLKKSAQAEFLEKVVIPETVERFNINENALYYKNGSIVYFMETKTPSNFKSIEIVAYGVEEADENEEGVGKDRLLTVLNGRLRQKIYIDGVQVPVPYAGIWTYNPTTDDHWLSKLEDNPEYDMEVFRSSTYENQHNLPKGYIESLINRLAPWEIESLIYGQRARRPKGNPVLHGFTIESHVRQLRLFPHLPLYRSWDFGFNHPCVSLFQYDPEFKRFMKYRELVGHQEQLQLFAPKAVQFTRALTGLGFAVIDVCDPHGADQRDVGESSVEYLRLHHGIHCNFKRQRVKTGLDEMQEMILSKAPFRPVDWYDGVPIVDESRFLIDASCKITISAYLGGYHRDEEGNPKKDDIHDHHADVDRFGIVHTMNQGLVHRMKSQSNKRYIPRNSIINV